MDAYKRARKSRTKGKSNHELIMMVLKETKKSLLQAQYHYEQHAKTIEVDKLLKRGAELPPELTNIERLELVEFIAKKGEALAQALKYVTFLMQNIADGESSETEYAKTWFKMYNYIEENAKLALKGFDQEALYRAQGMTDEVIEVWGEIPEADRV